MANERIDNNLKQAATWLCYLIILAGAVYALYTLRSILKIMLGIASPFIVGFIIAYIFDPIVSFFQKQLKVSRIFGLIVVYLLIILIIGLFLVWLLPRIYSQLVELLNFFSTVLPDHIEKIFEKIRGQLTVEQKERIQEAIQKLRENIGSVIESAWPGLSTVATGSAAAAGTVAKGFLQVLGSIISFFSFLSFMIVVSFFLIIDFSKIRPSLEPLVPPERRKRVLDLLKKVDTAVGGFLRGQMIDAFLVGVLTATCLLIAGFKEYALLIGFIAGIANIVPYLGPIIGATPAVVIVLVSPEYATLTEKLYGLLMVGGIFVFVQTIEGFVFQPFIVGKNSQLHPLLVLLGLLAGGQFGLIGLIVAIPTTAAVRVLVAELWWKPLCQRHTRVDDTPPEGKGHSSAQEDT